MIEIKVENMEHIVPTKHVDTMLNEIITLHIDCKNKISKKDMKTLKDMQKALAASVGALSCLKDLELINDDTYNGALKTYKEAEKKVEERIKEIKKKNDIKREKSEQNAILWDRIKRSNPNSKIAKKREDKHRKEQWDRRLADLQLQRSRIAEEWR